MNKLYIPDSYNYIGAFLTYACNMHCDYCINSYGGTIPVAKPMKTDQWVRALNRIETRDNLPITLGGGEPTCYPGFYQLVKGIRKDVNLDLLTNGNFNVEEFMRRIPPGRMRRSSKYASIRFSYHPGHTEVTTLLEKVSTMQQEGYSVGIWAVNHPDSKEPIEAITEQAKSLGIDFRLKEFLGEHDGKIMGTYKYPAAISGERHTVTCKPSELLVAPDGNIYNCHANLYNARGEYANILDKKVEAREVGIRCENFGACNPCDIKSKFNRFQEGDWCSVEIQ